MIRPDPNPVGFCRIDWIAREQAQCFKCALALEGAIHMLISVGRSMKLYGDDEKSWLCRSQQLYGKFSDLCAIPALLSIGLKS